MSCCRVAALTPEDIHSAPSDRRRDITSGLEPDLLPPSSTAQARLAHRRAVRTAHRLLRRAERGCRLSPERRWGEGPHVRVSVARGARAEGVSRAPGLVRRAHPSGDPTRDLAARTRRRRRVQPPLLGRPPCARRYRRGLPGRPGAAAAALLLGIRIDDLARTPPPTWPPAIAPSPSPRRARPAGASED